MYDGELEAQFYMLFDANKQLLGQGDIYPEVLHCLLIIKPADCESMATTVLTIVIGSVC